jgi:protein-S-isoprenylcysteine O-methyltransferase Ste14
MKKKLIPPKFLNGFLVLAIGLHFIIPIRQIINSPYTFLGFIIIFLGIALDIWSVIVLKKNNTTTDFDTKSTRLVTNGPFSISRNPIYLSGVILSLGISILLGSLITFVFPIALFMILNKYHIPFEEMKLKKTFGPEYLKYKQRVRRWI